MSSQAFATQSRRRLSIYLEQLMTANGASRNSVGRLVDVTANRVTKWLNGERYMSAETAFELGEAARSNLRWSTSGVEFLWATGHFPEVLAILKYLSADDAGDGTELAAMLYSWLPACMLDFEIENIKVRSKEKYEFDSRSAADFMGMNFNVDRSGESWSGPNVNESTVREALAHDSGGREAIRYGQEQALLRGETLPQLEAFWELDDRFRSKTIRARVQTAWSRYLAQNLELTNSMLALRIGGSIAIADSEMAIIDAMIQAATSLREVMFPSYAIPRIWRMLSGWIYEIDEAAAEKWTAVLPDNFVNHRELLLRDEAENKRIADIEQPEPSADG